MNKDIVVADSLVTISIVSHGHASYVEALIRDIEKIEEVSYEIILTVNIAEDCGYLSQFKHLPIIIIENGDPKGFGANHNQAFENSKGDFFIVLNPDIRANNLKLKQLLVEASDPKVGVSAPLVLSPKGSIEDSARKFPSVARLFSRFFLKKKSLDYEIGSDPIVVDWVAGMFMVFRRNAFSKVGGFDETYFMYMEDIDICKRMNMLGYQVVLSPSASVVHWAQRQSHTSLKHLYFHITSMIKYFRKISNS